MANPERPLAPGGWLSGFGVGLVFSKHTVFLRRGAGFPKPAPGSAKTRPESGLGKNLNSFYMEEPKPIIFICLLLALCACNQNPKQEHKAALKTDASPANGKIFKRETFKQEVAGLSNELSEFVPANYSVLDTISGDLNLDKTKDYLVVLKKNGESTSSDVIDNPEKRPLLILLRNEKNKLELARRNDNTVYCIDCGGMMGDPYMGMTVKNGYFSVEHYGGSSWRWTRIITYRYSKRDNEWFLHKDGSESFHASESGKPKSEIKTAKDFGRIKFEDFDIYKQE